MNNNPDHVCISDCSPPISVAGSASPESLSSAFAAEKALLAHREQVEQMLRQARLDSAAMKDKHFFVLGHWIDEFARGLVEYLETVKWPKPAGPSAANGRLNDCGEQTGA